MKPRTVTKLKTSGQLRHRSVVSPLISTDKVARYTSGGKGVCLDIVEIECFMLLPVITF